LKLIDKMPPPAKKQRTDNGAAVTACDNYINGEWVSPTTGKYMERVSPVDGKPCSKVALSGADDVKAAVAAAEKAVPGWTGKTVKARIPYLIKLYNIMTENKMELIRIINREHGKTFTECLGEVNKGMETLEYAIGMPQIIPGRTLTVSGGSITCQDDRIPHGIVASIVPFNFPAMVPFWTLPIALATGNCVILKPSEKVPLTMRRITEMIHEAGFPAGVFQLINGTVAPVNEICDNPAIKAVTFVGSTKIAEIVAKRCRNNNKRCTALGGAKNHLVALPDCNLDMAAQDIVNSFTGCAGERCMAASALLLIGDQKNLVDKVVELAGLITPGSGEKEFGKKTSVRPMGPIIDKASMDRIVGYIDGAEKSGSQILLDGRKWVEKYKEGYWVGPTVIMCQNKDEPAMTDEIFGPVISVLQVANKEEAIAVENGNPYGNAACIYTSVGEHARWFSDRFSAGMIGVNVGVPVPREPFSFGGINRSKFGDMDITGDAAVEFFTYRRKVTTKWTPPPEGQANWMS
jgi:malonate-semialdehyde dehydrogenase (acetylating)/methylmalonate-semialdehyde dehydrogenase